MDLRFTIFAIVLAASCLSAFIAMAARQRQRGKMEQRRRLFLSREFSCPASPVDRQFYFVRAHVYDTQFVSMWEELTCEFPPDRLFLLFDNTSHSLPDSFMNQYGHRVVLHNASGCKERNPLQENLWKHVECPLVLMYEFLEANFPWFTYAWVIEQDIYCDGSWRKALSKADHMLQDLLTVDMVPYPASRERSSTWPLWDSFQGDIDSIPMKERWKGFFPSVRFSPKILELIRENMGQNTGYCESYIPTLAVHNGLTVASLPPSMLGRFSAKRVLEGNIVPDQKDDRLYHKFELYKND